MTGFEWDWTQPLFQLSLSHCTKVLNEYEPIQIALG